jgi:uncharacterized protein YijF (DUF1287 family)
MLSRDAKIRLLAVAALASVLPLNPPTIPSCALQVSRGSLTAQGRFFRALVAAAVERTHHVVRYDPAYVRIPYPGGDVPSSTGVCTDEVIRAYRAVGVDLQKEVHEDMLAYRSAYPRKWAAARMNGDGTDTNIDHRRVPNLMVLFSRKGQSLPTSLKAADYQPGDIVVWNLSGGITHVAIVVDQKSPDAERYLLVHNIGAGPKMGRCALQLENHRPLSLLEG